MATVFVPFTAACFGAFFFAGAFFVVGGLNAPCAVTVADAVLLATLVSGCVSVTVAWFTRAPGTPARVTIVMVALAPAASVPRLQVSGAVVPHDP